MTESTPPETDAGRIAGLRVMLVALACGLIFLTGVMAFSANKMNAPIAADAAVGYVLMGVGVLGIVASFVVPMFVPIPPAGETATISAHPTAAEHDALWKRYTAETLVRAGLAGGGGVISSIAYFVTTDPVVLVPVPVAAALILSMIPSAGKFAAHVEKRRGGR